MDTDDQLLFEEFDIPSLPDTPSHPIITYPAVPTHKIITKSGIETIYLGKFHDFECYMDTLAHLQPNQAFVPLYKAIRGDKTIYFMIKNKSIIYVLNNSGVKYYYDYYIKYHSRIYPLEFYNEITKNRDHKYESKLSPYSIPFKNGSITEILNDFVLYLDLHMKRSILGGKTRRKKYKPHYKQLSKHRMKKMKKQSRIKNK